MESQSYREILKRVGVVLVVVGLADIAWMIYCIIHKISYSSSLNLFAVIAGILLMRGSLRTAANIRWFGVFFLSASIAMLMAWPALQPIDLTLTEIRRRRVRRLRLPGSACCGVLARPSHSPLAPGPVQAL
jgi:hypothetical protein